MNVAWAPYGILCFIVAMVILAVYDAPGLDDRLIGLIGMIFAWIAGRVSAYINQGEF